MQGTQSLLAIIGFIAIFVYPLLILEPITQLIRHHPASKIVARFSMGDLLSLLFLVQLPFALMNPTDIAVNEISIIGIGLLALVSGIVWYAGLRAANHIGIQRQLKRFVAIAFTFPIAISGGFVLLFVLQGLTEPDEYSAARIWAGGWVVFTLLAAYSARWVIRDSLMLTEPAPLPWQTTSSDVDSKGSAP